MSALLAVREQIVKVKLEERNMLKTRGRDMSDPSNRRGGGGHMTSTWLHVTPGPEHHQ